MTWTKIENPSIEPVTLPYPLRGVLRGRQAITIGAPPDFVVQALGGTQNPTAATGGLLISEVAEVGQPDDISPAPVISALRIIDDNGTLNVQDGIVIVGSLAAPLTLPFPTEPSVPGQLLIIKNGAPEDVTLPDVGTTGLVLAENQVWIGCFLPIPPLGSWTTLYTDGTPVP